MAGLEAAYEGRTIANLPVELATAMAKAGATSPTLRLRQGDAAAVAEALAMIADEKADAAKRQQLIAIFGTINQPRCVPRAAEDRRRIAQRRPAQRRARRRCSRTATRRSAATVIGLYTRPARPGPRRGPVAPGQPQGLGGSVPGGHRRRPDRSARPSPSRPSASCSCTIRRRSRSCAKSTGASSPARRPKSCARRSKSSSA